MRMTPFKPGAGPGSDTGEVEYYINNRYQVMLRKGEDFTGQPVKVLSIRRQDRKAIMDWRDLQWIKNQLLGPEEEAVQIFPAESRLVDTSNQYWLWSYPGKVVPMGFTSRGVSENITVTLDGHGASRQRPFADHVRPVDLDEQEKLLATSLPGSKDIHDLLAGVIKR